VLISVRILLIVLLCCGGSKAWLLGQTRQHIDYFQVGVFAGASHYSGDLSPNADPLFPGAQLAGLQQARFSAAVFASYHWHPHMSVRLQLGYGQVRADDAQSDNAINRRRNLSFGSNLFEASLQLHYDYFGNLRDYRYRARLTPFVFAGIGVVAFDPYAYRDPIAQSGKTFLRPLRTEGQEQAYAPVALVIPFGGGLKYRLSDLWDLRLEVGLRLTTTDYLDDVSGNTAPPVAPTRQGHPLPSALGGGGDRAFFSYRATGATDYGLRRGNPATNDWYVFSGLSLAYILDNPAPCPKVKRRGRLRD